MLRTPFEYKSIMNADDDDVIIDMLDGQKLIWDLASTGDCAWGHSAHYIIGVCDIDEYDDIEIFIGTDFASAKKICDRFDRQSLSDTDIYNFRGDPEIQSFHIFHDEVSQVIELDGTRTLFDFRVSKVNQKTAFKQFMDYISGGGSEPVPETCNMEDIIF